MWKLLRISEQTYFISCNFNDNTKDLIFLLYDFKNIWSETLHLINIKQKVKILNKRFDFNEDNIKEAFTSESIHSAVLEDAINQDSRLLKLKYRVKNCVLSYEWSLKKREIKHFHQTIVQPLLLTILDSQQQIEILKDSIRKKDMELKQFRIEGAVLNRKTLVTKPFDFDVFSEKFEVCNKTASNFMELAKYVKETKLEVNPEAIRKNIDIEKTGPNIKPGEIVKEEQKTKTKLSPRQIKRKATDIKMDRLQQHLKLRRQGLEYESSQSQTLSSGGSQTIQEFEKNNNKKIQTKKVLSPRKSPRCLDMKAKYYKISSDDKTDTDNENNSSALRPKRTTKCLDNLKTDIPCVVSLDNKTAEANTPTDHPQGTEQAIINSSSSQKNTSGKLVEDTNIFDFFTDSDDDLPLLKRKNSQKTKTKKELESQKLMDIKLNKKTSLLSSNNIPVLDFTSVENASLIKLHSANNSLSQPSTPVVIDEISSQLDNIKKELETLEAMRLADLQQRMCKV